MSEHNIDTVETKHKWYQLLDNLSQYKNSGIVLAFSGGVDSSLLAKAAQLAVAQRAVAVCFVSPLMSDGDKELAQQIAEQIGITLALEAADVLAIPQVANNCRERCYFCKRHLYALLKKYAEGHGLEILIDGNNSDDLSVYRPGLRAAEEMKVLHPLASVGLTKPEIRYLAHWQGLSNYALPANACLATRFPYNTQLVEEALRRVEAGERILHQAGFRAVRLRVHGELARIEVELPQLSALVARKDIATDLRQLGFKYITADLGGLTSGSMDL